MAWLFKLSAALLEGRGSTVWILMPPQPVPRWSVRVVMAVCVQLRSPHEHSLLAQLATGTGRWHLSVELSTARERSPRGALFRRAVPERVRMLPEATMLAQPGCK